MQEDSSTELKTFEHKHDYPLERRKLNILERMCQYSLQKLLLFFSVKEYREAIKLDTTKLIKELLNDENFQISYPKQRVEKCKNKNHPKQSTTPKCLPPACKFTCGNCANIVQACCKTCQSCTNCTLKKLGIKDWNELYIKLVNGDQINGDICEILLLRFSLILLIIFRNFTFHLTDAKCKDIEEGSIEDSEISLFCKSWTDIQKTFKFSIEQVFKFLKDKNIISEKKMKFHKEFMEKMITAKQHSELNDFMEKKGLN